MNEIKVYSQKQEQEFYKLIGKTKSEIQQFDISEKEKHKLYHLVDETIQRFEKNKRSYLNSQINLAQLKESEKNLEKEMEILDTNRKIISFNLDNIIEISRHSRYKGYFH